LRDESVIAGRNEWTAGLAMHVMGIENGENTTTVINLFVCFLGR